jgi:hypothetical protein
MHTMLTVYSGDSVLVPVYLCLMSGAALVALRRDDLNGRQLMVVAFGFAALLTANIVSNVVADGIVEDRVRGAVQLSASIVVGLGLYLALCYLPAETTRRVFWWSWLVITLVGGLEVYGGLRPIVQEGVQLLYSGSPRMIYDADLRDIEIYGVLRPMVFASEPSFAGVSVTMMLLGFSLTDPGLGSIRAALNFTLMFVISIVCVPTLTLPFGGLIYLLWFFSYCPGLLRLALLAAAFAAITLYSTAVAVTGGEGLFAVVARHAQTGSFFGRTVAPFLTAVRVVMQLPFNGVGVGFEQGALQEILVVWSRAGALARFPWFSDSPAKDLITSSFWWHWIFFGLFGGLLFLALTWQYLKQLGVRRVALVLASTGLSWMTIGGYVDPRSWGILYILAACSRIQEQCRQRRFASQAASGEGAA